MKLPVTSQIRANLAQLVFVHYFTFIKSPLFYRFSLLCMTSHFYNISLLYCISLSYTTVIQYHTVSPIKQYLTLCIISLLQVISLLYSMSLLHSISFLITLVHYLTVSQYLRAHTYSKSLPISLKYWFPTFTAETIPSLAREFVQLSSPVAVHQCIVQLYCTVHMYCAVMCLQNWF